MHVICDPSLDCNVDVTLLAITMCELTILFHIEIKQLLPKVDDSELCK